ncbi:hypothetical protein IV102_28255 [bacterium]|nr:hypothetical protein [bacterium]
MAIAKGHIVTTRFNQQGDNTNLVFIHLSDDPSKGWAVSLVGSSSDLLVWMLQKAVKENTVVEILPPSADNIAKEFSFLWNP